jgi:hypothetical protein
MLALELTCLASKIRKKVCRVLDNFLSFLKKCLYTQLAKLCVNMWVGKIDIAMLM